MKKTLPLVIILIALFFKQQAFSADKKAEEIFKLDLSPIPAFSLYEEPLIIRLMLSSEMQFDKKEIDKKITVTCQTKDNPGKLNLTNIIPLVYGVYNYECVFTLQNTIDLKNQVIIFKLTSDAYSVSKELRLVDISNTSAKFEMRQNILYAGDRQVIVLMHSFNESRYRKWLLPEKIINILTAPEKQKILFLNADFPENNIGEYTNKLSDDFRILASNGDESNSARVLSLFTKMMNEKYIYENTVVIYPGIASIYELTPLNVFRESLEATLVRSEKIIENQRHIQSFILLPAVPDVLEIYAKPYFEVLENIAARHHLEIIDCREILKQSSPWSEEGGNLYLTNLAKRRIASEIAYKINLRKERYLLYSMTLLFIIALYLFIWIQLKTHNRLKKLIAISLEQP